MSVGSRVRKIYERRPYPPPALRGKVARTSLPGMEWVQTIGETRPGKTPARILVAGCGAGTEAFTLARTYPAAEVLGVDFSARSIGIAKRMRRKTEGAERVRFEVADLTSGNLVDITGKSFDLVSCHGVLSYIPEVGPVLRNFARLLSRDGILVLGVNGAAHPSLRWRPLLASFGLDPDEFVDSARARDVIKVCESIMVYPPLKLSHLDAGYLAGDIFGPLNRSLPLSEWVRQCSEAGLHFFGSHRTFFAVKELLNHDLHSMLMPRTRAEVALLVDAIQPTSFHHMVLSRRRPSRWDNGALLTRRPSLTPLYTAKFPRRTRHWNALRDVVLESPSMATRVTLSIPQWEVDLLRNCDGVLSVRELLSGVKPAVPARALREALYLVYLLGVINVSA